MQNAQYMKSYDYKRAFLSLNALFGAEREKHYYCVYTRQSSFKDQIYSELHSHMVIPKTKVSNVKDNHILVDWKCEGNRNGLLDCDSKINTKQEATIVLEVEVKQALPTSKSTACSHRDHTLEDVLEKFEETGENARGKGQAFLF